MSEEELAQLRHQVQRERTARKEAERLLEEKSLALYQFNQQMKCEISERQRNEEALKTAHEELIRKNGRLEMFQQVAVNREMRMLEMKAEINGLLERLGEPIKYKEVDILRKG
jgi:C4-dicarboxylate-specific signal transduction histidine kinase